MRIFSLAEEPPGAYASQMKNLLMVAVGILAAGFVGAQDGLDSQLNKDLDPALLLSELKLSPDLERQIKDWQLFSGPINLSAAFERTRFSSYVSIGSGVDVRDFNSTKYSPFKNPSYDPFKIVAGTFTYGYFKAASDVASAVGAGSGFEASIATSKFSFGLDFQSEEMKQHNQSATNGYIVIYFNPEYDGVKQTNTGLMDSARKLAEKSDKTAFFERYGTHYVSDAKPNASYAMIYTFSADSKSSLDGFESDLGLNIGLPEIFSVGFSDSLKTQLKKRSQQISFTFKEYFTTSAGIEPIEVGSDPLDPLATFDKEAITKRYNKYLAGFQGAKVPFYWFKLSPYSDLPDFGMSQPPKNLVATALNINQNLSSLIADYNLMYSYGSIWGNDYLPALDVVEALRTSADALDQSILSIFANPKSTSIELELKANLKSATEKGHQFFGNPTLWPVHASVKLEKGTIADSFLLHFKTDARVGKPMTSWIGLEEKTGAPVQEREIEVNKEGELEENKVKFNLWKTGPLKPVAAAGLSLQIYLRDNAGRSGEVLFFSPADPQTPVIDDQKWTDFN